MSVEVRPRALPAALMTALVLVLSSCAPARRTPASAKPVASPAAVESAAANRGDGLRRVPFGLCEDYPEETRTIAEVERDFDTLAEAGVRVLRVSVGWDGVEGTDDQFDLAFWDAVVARARARGIRLLPYVAYTPSWATRGRGEPEQEDPVHWKRPPRDPAEFGEVMQVLAARYAGTIDTWELWNEPDNRDYWLGTVDEYVRLLAAGAAGVRRGNPAARTVFGGIAGGTAFLREAFAAGAARSVDVVNAHAYYETWNPLPLETLPGYLDEIAEIIEHHGEREPIWLAELGYGNFRRGRHVAPGVEARFAYEHTEAFQAGALVRLTAMALAHPATSLFAWYEVKDLPGGASVIGDENNRHLGVLRVDRAPKPSFAALRFVARLFGPGFRVLPAGEAAIESTGGAQARAFLLADRRRVVIAWLPTRGAAWDAARATPNGDAVDARTARISVTFAGPERRPGTRYDELGREVATVPAAGARAAFDMAGGQVAIVVWP